MLFNSLAFAIFLPIVFIIYWIIPQKYRWCVLLVSSYYFYMSWNPKYVVLILGTTLISYIAGILIEKSKSRAQKRVVIIATAIVCLGVLFIFKYFNFAMESFFAILKISGLSLNPITLKLLLPVGISFYTFQTLSYVIDVYRGDIEAEQHFGYYATFISFFPQLVAGPIERTSNLLPQIKAKLQFDEALASSGMRLMLWGFFKKIIIADTTAFYVDKVYGTINKQEGFSLVLAIFFFTMQIYCDFSGYSDIAVGTSKLLGIKLMKNFDCPYLATSINEFWKRWHISLSTWFRDYVYIPLGGNHCSKNKQKINLLVTFLISGLWHGANWTYVFWGGIHGVAQIIENSCAKGITKIKKSKFGLLLSWAFVFLFCNIAWVFFRATTIHEAFYVLTHWITGMNNPIVYIKKGFLDAGMWKEELCEMVIALAILFCGDWISQNKRLMKRLEGTPRPIRWLGYLLFIWLILILIPTNEGGAFIYFQF